MENFIKIDFSSLSENEAFARIAVAAFAAQLDPTLEQLADIKTAVSEAVTNSIVHGYGENSGIVTLIMSRDGSRLVFEIIDKGRGIDDIDRARQPLYTSSPDRERSGMGFTVMESFMDSLDIKSTPGMGTSVTMTKKIL